MVVVVVEKAEETLLNVLFCSVSSVDFLQLNLLLRRQLQPHKSRDETGWNSQGCATNLKVGGWLNALENGRVNTVKTLTFEKVGGGAWSPQLLWWRRPWVGRLWIAFS